MFFTFDALILFTNPLMDFLSASHAILWYSGLDASRTVLLSRIICASLNGGTYAPPERPPPFLRGVFFAADFSSLFFVSFSSTMISPSSSKVFVSRNRLRFDRIPFSSSESAASSSSLCLLLSFGDDDDFLLRRGGGGEGDDRRPLRVGVGFIEFRIEEEYVRACFLFDIMRLKCDKNGARIGTKKSDTFFIYL